MVDHFANKTLHGYRLNSMYFEHWKDVTRIFPRTRIGLGASGSSRHSKMPLSVFSIKFIRVLARALLLWTHQARCGLASIGAGSVFMAYCGEVGRTNRWMAYYLEGKMS